MSKTRFILTGLIWLLCWIAGLIIAGVSLSHLLSDRHVWDARVSLPVQAAGLAQETTFRSLSGGEVAVFVTSYSPSGASAVPFRGKLGVTVTNERGEILRETVVGPGGIAHAQTTGSAWTPLATLIAPRLWFKPWTLRARVLAPDPEFAAGRLDVLLRQQRRDLGMGGMVYYITIFVGLGLLAIALAVAAMSTRVLGWLPVIFTAVSVLAFGLLLLI